MSPEARRITASRKNEKAYLLGLGRLIPIATEISDDAIGSAESQSECIGTPLRVKREETDFMNYYSHTKRAQSTPEVSPNDPSTSTGPTTTCTRTSLPVKATNTERKQLPNNQRRSLVPQVRKLSSDTGPDHGEALSSSRRSSLVTPDQ